MSDVTSQNSDVRTLILCSIYTQRPPLKTLLGRDVVGWGRGARRPPLFPEMGYIINVPVTSAWFSWQTSPLFGLLNSFLRTTGTRMLSGISRRVVTYS